MNRAMRAIKAATCKGISRRATKSESHCSSACGAIIANTRGIDPIVITFAVFFQGNDAQQRWAFHRHNTTLRS